MAPLPRRSKARAALATAVVLFALAFTPQATAQPTNDDTPPVQAVLGDPLKMPRAVSCSDEKAATNRTESCYENIHPLEFRKVTPPFDVAGKALLYIKSEAKLNAKDRTNWTHTVTLELREPSGWAISGVTADTSLNATHSDATWGGLKPLPAAQKVKFTMSVGSPGREKVKETQAPAFKFALPAYPGGTLPIEDELSEAVTTVRCDNDASINPTKGGCVYPNYTPTYNVSTVLADQDQVAWHIWWAQTNLDQAWGRKGHGPALTRTQDPALNQANRDKACPDSIPRPPGKSCDEYPFASTHEGASKNPDFSCHMVPANQNSQEGSNRGAWYGNNRVLEKDKFWVNVILPPAGSEITPPPAPRVQCPG
ncbi:NucA/NucB deoxyribonuclease domain-containing protein [Streptomyces sp. T-3]|nr:NucA/NucB deoxyribonuclease domain-containing protein [Streptomyces sp. T-3]